MTGRRVVYEWIVCPQCQRQFQVPVEIKRADPSEGGNEYPEALSVACPQGCALTAHQRRQLTAEAEQMAAATLAPPAPSLRHRLAGRVGGC